MYLPSATKALRYQLVRFSVKNRIDDAGFYVMNCSMEAFDVRERQPGDQIVERLPP